MRGCRELYSAVLKGVECMQSSFSTIKIALSHTKSVAIDLKDRFYELNTQMVWIGPVYLLCAFIVTVKRILCSV